MILSTQRKKFALVAKSLSFCSPPLGHYLCLCIRKKVEMVNESLNDDIMAEAARNREIRIRNRIEFESKEKASKSSQRRWSKWALEPINAAVYALMIALQKGKRKKLIKQYLSSPGFKGLHIGCGPFKIDGWQNTDYLYPRQFYRGLSSSEREIDFHLDITEALPYPSNSLDAIFAEEVIEHVSQRDAEEFLKEAVRVLKVGGVLRLTTPDATGICRVFSGNSPGVSVKDFEPFWLNPFWSEDIWLNSNFRYYGHQHIWSYEGLTASLITAGFSRTERVSIHETVSSFSELVNLERHAISNQEIIRISKETRLLIEAFK